MKKYIIVSIVSLLCTVVLIILFINNNFDIVKNTAANSFNDLLINNEIKKEKQGSNWVVTMPDETTKLIFYISEKETKILLKIDAKPFADNGLDVTKLPPYISYNNVSKELTIESIYGNKKLDNDSTINFIYDDIITTYRDKLGYHSILDHFGLLLEDGNAFEYAKDISTNDKDIVVVLNPSIFINASVDIENLVDYKYIDVEMDNGDKVKKLVKIFELKGGTNMFRYKRKLLISSIVIVMLFSTTGCANNVEKTVTNQSRDVNQTNEENSNIIIPSCH